MRIARALRELAEALDDTENGEQWEVVRESLEGSLASAAASEAVASPKAKAKSKPKAKAASSTSSTSSVTSPHPRDWRCYVITHHPHGKVGFVEGLGPATWTKIEGILPGNRLAGSGARLRRVASRAEALELWKTKHGSDRDMPDLIL